MKRIKSIARINKFIILFIASLIISGAFYVVQTYNITSFDQVLYTVQHAEGAGIAPIITGIIVIVIVSIFVFLLFIFPYIIIDWKYYIQINASTKKKDRIIVLDGIKKHQFLYSILVLLFSSLAALQVLGFYRFLFFQNQYSLFIDNTYVDPDDLILEFPEEKQNLIYIYLESMEATAGSKSNGGNQKLSYIPNLERIALSNISFSDDEDLGGGNNLYGTNWTVAAMFAQSSGLPLKHDYNRSKYKSDTSFMNGTTTIGDILADNGYSNHLMIGSLAEFGKREDFYTRHGNYEIFDYDTAVDKGLIAEDYYVWWGFEDRKLFEFAKKKVSELSKQEKPFNLTLLTVDTHFQDGYLDKKCSSVFDNHYADSIYCSDSIVGDFIEWLEKQDFFDNTTIVLVGDHLTMQNGFYKDSSYNRVFYNSFINSKVDPINTKNRVFTSLDMFPTTLAALGVKIPGDQLGLGVNLFSDKKTLAEENDLYFLDYELAKKSAFYSNELSDEVYMNSKRQQNTKAS